MTGARAYAADQLFATLDTTLRRIHVPGADPIVLGESVNTITTYGFDPVTGMQETKATLCQVRAA